MKWTNENVEKLHTAFIETGRVHLAAEQLGVSYQSACTMLRKIGVKVLNRTNRSRHVDHHFFDNIDTEAKAYVYGLLTADGYISRKHISISLTKADGALLNQVHCAMGRSGRLFEVEPTSRSKRGAKTESRLVIYSTRICAQLLNLGLGPNKSFTVSFPLWMRPELHRHYVRGVFDGDGSLTARLLDDSGAGNLHMRGKWEIVGSRSTILGIVETIRFHLGIELRTRSIVYSGGELLLCTSTRRLDVLRICEWMYNDSSIKLARKHATYLKLVDYREQWEAADRPTHCSVEGCEGKHKGRGFCEKHLQEYWYWLKPEDPARRCSEPGCDRLKTVRGLCRKHYEKMRYDKRKGILQ